jgi:alcohol dehydrogenase class IV
VLPHVIKFNSEYESDIYYGLLSERKPENNGRHLPDILIDQINRYFEIADVSKKLEHYGVVEKDLELLAAEAMDNWTSKFNPRPLKKDDFLTLYKNAF